MDTDKYGWIVAVDLAAHLEADGKKHFTINLVRPWCSGENEQNFPRGPMKQDATGLTGSLWFPWDWADGTEWDVYGRFDEGGARKWKLIKGVSAPSLADESDPLTDAKSIREQVTKEISLATEHTSYPLSMAPEDLQARGSRSHVHSLAPLTHWPARISAGVLRMSWLMEGADELFDKCDAVVCYPKFTMAPGTVVTHAAQKSTLGPFSDFKAGKPGYVVDYDDPNVAFVALAVDPHATTPDYSGTSLELSQGAVSRSAVLAAFTGNLLPLPVLLAWAGEHEQAPATLPGQMALVRALWESIGFGREYSTPTAGRPNIVEFLVKESAIADAMVLRIAIEANVDSIPEQEKMRALRAAAKALSEAPVTNTWTRERRQVWADVQQPLERLLDGKLKAAEAFRTDWLVLAMLLATEDGLCELMGLWLANVLDALFVVPAARDAWVPVKAKLATPGEFRKDLMMRALPFMGSDTQWNAARDVVKNDDAPTVAKLVDATVDAAKAVLGSGSDLPVSEIEAIAATKVQKFRDELTRDGDENRARPRDRGLKLDFSAWDSAGPIDADHRIRGYAIALCSGLMKKDAAKWTIDETRAQWLTDTAMLVNSKWAEDSNGTAWMHESVGATSANGEKLVSVEYEGAAVATAMSVDYENEDKDGFKCVDYAWESERLLPLLGYGLHYAALATPLDNVGSVIDKDLRGSHATQLKVAKVALSSVTPALRYLSREIPGAPDCTALEQTLYELSDETRAHAWQLRKIAELAQANPRARPPNVAKVALLAADEAITVGGAAVPLFDDKVAKRTCEFTVTAHGTHSAFIERWLATDALLVENTLPPSDPKLGINASKIFKFAKSFREQKGPRVVANSKAYHPAVSAIGVALMVEDKLVDHRVIDIDRVFVDAQGDLAAKVDQITVKVSATMPAPSAQPKLTVNAKVVLLEVPRGTFACLRFYSLVPESYFTQNAVDQRFSSGLMNTGVTAFTNYRAFSPSELWFETLPAWPATGLAERDVKMNLSPPREVAEGLLSPNLLLADLQFPVAPAWAHWLKGAYVQRHEWHWTGYPVEFPSGEKDLAEWIPSLAGVESFREIIDAEFTTAFGGANDWRIGIHANGYTVVHRWMLSAGARPTRYVAYLARPMLRFRRWLNPKLGASGPFAVESHIYAKGMLVPGRMRAGEMERLATPALRHSIPLTASYAKGLQRGPNGVMLVFDDAIRRTDDLAHVGGLGDTLEIDLVDTRVQGIPEMGNNPIFHARDPRPAGAGTLSTDPAFGLTFDIGPNPKVAQTAMVVRPLDSGGRWVMAMARARRYILPETELGTMLHEDNAAHPTSHLAAIPTRLDGKDVIPLDFVLDVDAPLAAPLILEPSRLGAMNLTIAVPSAPAHDPAVTRYRYLVTWHKARWEDGGDPKWRCQVILQSRDGARLAWNRLGTVRGFANQAAEIKPAELVDRWFLVADAHAKRPEARAIRISDYTAPRWLTFIGSFGNDMPGIANDYRFVVRNGALRALELAPGSKAPMPMLRNRQASLEGGEPTFHLALVFRAVPDAVQLRTEPGTGELVACYFVHTGKDPDFFPRTAGDTPPASLDGCYAHIVTLQRITSLRAADPADRQDKGELGKLSAATLPELLECAFPAQGETAAECLLRILPEYLGPIPILA